MLLKYLINKLYNRIYLKLLKRNRVFPNLYHIGTHISKRVRTIVFYFPGAKFMNFGDHLFFEPVCRLLKTNGYDVSIIPLSEMKYYFEKAGIKTGDINTIDNYDLIISRPDFIKEVKDKRNVVLIDIAYAGIKEPLINDLCKKFTLYFDLKHNVSAKPTYVVQNIDCFQKFHLQKNKRYVVFNNYLTSGSFRVAGKKYDKLEKFIKDFKQKNPLYLVIHTGSKNDKIKDKKQYGFVDIDLRGKTSIMDLFDLSALPNLDYYIGFDAFVMHLFFLKEKKAYVLSRGRWTEKERNFLENFIDPPYAVEKVELIKEYIR